MIYNLRCYCYILTIKTALLHLKKACQKPGKPACLPTWLTFLKPVQGLDFFYSQCPSIYNQCQYKVKLTNSFTRYGLGQLYEILKQPTNALYHYQQAHKCRLLITHQITTNYSHFKTGRFADVDRFGSYFIKAGKKIRLRKMLQKGISNW